MQLYPQLAKTAETTTLEHFITDDRWVMEQKLDGHRLLLESPGTDGPPIARTRNGTPYTRRLPKTIQDFRFPSDEGWILDGEIVDGTFWVFDIPLMPEGGKQMPLWQRRTLLETLLANIRHPFRLVPQAKTRDEKIALAEKAIAQCAEGLLLKRADSPYRSAGRTEEWLKLKFTSTADCIVTDVRADGKDSVGLGLVNEDGITIVDVGRASLIGKEKRGTISPGDVIEVRYLYTGAGGRLYQPTILRLRDDKTPPECSVQQLKHVNKAVLETL